MANLIIIGCHLIPGKSVWNLVNLHELVIGYCTATINFECLTFLTDNFFYWQLVLAMHIVANAVEHKQISFLWHHTHSSIAISNLQIIPKNSLLMQYNNTQAQWNVYIYAPFGSVEKAFFCSSQNKSIKVFPFLCVSMASKSPFPTCSDTAAVCPAILLNLFWFLLNVYTN